MRSVALAAGLVAATTGLCPHIAVAGCTNDVVARIAFPPGQYCWAYHGTATSFAGGFGRGQRVTVHMSGEESSYDDRTGRVRTTVGPRDPNVTGPGDFFASGGNGDLAFVTPRAGAYVFSFGPCADWHGNGIVEICAQ